MWLRWVHYTQFKVLKPSTTGNILGGLVFAKGTAKVVSGVSKTASVSGRAGELSTAGIQTGANAAKTGLTNAQLVQKAATKAEAAIGGTGRFAGTAKHNYATNLLERYQSIYGHKGLDFKVPFNNGPANRGFLDVLDKTNGIIYDWKFGYPSMTPTQLNMTPQMIKYQSNFGLPTQVIKPL